MTRSVEIPDAAVEAAFRSWNGMHVGTARDRLHDALVAARPYLMPDREEIEEALFAQWLVLSELRTVAAPVEHCRVFADAVLALLSTSGGEE